MILSAKLRASGCAVATEFGAGDLPVLMDVDFGHTDPKLILPLGVPIEVDPAGSRLRLLESPFL
jgi:muramoyltetrapeptide carboxypeptidase LdcA involved in peptidoglycan recycling